MGVYSSASTRKLESQSDVTPRAPDEAEKAQTRVDVYGTAKPGSWQRMKRFLGFTEGRDNTREMREE
jgi:hypothetical protein